MFHNKLTLQQYGLFLFTLLAIGLVTNVLVSIPQASAVGTCAFDLGHRDAKAKVRVTSIAFQGNKIYLTISIDALPGQTLPREIEIKVTAAYSKTGCDLSSFSKFKTVEKDVRTSDGRHAEVTISVPRLGPGNYLFMVEAFNDKTDELLGWHLVDPEDREGTAQSPPAGDDKNVPEASKYI